jgi:putative nucleotidyltransferase with HDIG domain
VVSALSHALDITEGQPPGHAVRTCVIGMRIAEVLGLHPRDRSALFYTLLLKDLGCSSNAARLAKIFRADDLSLKRAHKLTDWTNGKDSARYALAHARANRGALARAWQTVLIGLREKGSGREMTETRCERGAEIATMLGLNTQTADGIRALDEHWDGAGMPYSRKGDQIPLFGRIAGLCQTVDVFATAFGPDIAFDVARQRRGTWFDPALVNALHSFERDHAFWSQLLKTDQLAHVSALEPPDQVLLADEERLDTIAEAFASVIDAKSPYTATHSAGVARIATAIASEMGAPEEDLVTLRRAGLLHDIGKLGVSNLILDKPGRLSEQEMGEMRRHTGYTMEILSRVRRFSSWAPLAASHHERLDGSGYHLGLPGDLLGPLARILAVADVAEALTATRPYRAGLPREQVHGILRKQMGRALDPLIVQVAEAIPDW